MTSTAAPADFPEATFVETNGVRLAVYEQGSGQPVIFLHGFPELAYSWRYQTRWLRWPPRAYTAIRGEFDIVPANPRMDLFVHDLQQHTLPCGHWIQHQAPAATNNIIVEWLRARFSA